MTHRLLLPLLALSLGQAAHADNVTTPLKPAMQTTGLTAAPDPGLNWRDPQWLNRQREASPWRYSLGLERQLRSPQQLGPQAAVREAVWAGVSYDFNHRLSGGVETPVWQRDSGWASRMAFEKPRNEGLAGLRGAFSYQLSPQSRLTLKPQARRVMVSYSATW